MAEFITTCPHCNVELQAQDEWIGMEVECPICKKSFMIQMNNPNLPVTAENQTETLVNDKKSSPTSGEKHILIQYISNFFRMADKRIIILMACVAVLVLCGIIATFRYMEKETIEAIQQKINIALTAKTAEESIAILQEIKVGYPNHFLIKKVDKHIADYKQYIVECNIVRKAIEQARSAEYYQESFKILEDIISRYPSNYYTAEARNLLQQYRDSYAKSKSQKTCPACNGRGKYSRFWNSQYNKSYTCNLCRGRGKISAELRAKVSQCGYCKGSGLLRANWSELCTLCDGDGWKIVFTAQDMGLEAR